MCFAMSPFVTCTQSVGRLVSHSVNIRVFDRENSSFTWIQVQIPFTEHYMHLSVRPSVHPSGTRSDGSPLDINRRPTDTEWPPPSAIDRASTLYRHRGSVVREIESDRRTNGTRPSPVSSRPRSRTAWPSSDQQNASLHVTERQDGYTDRERD